MAPQTFTNTLYHVKGVTSSAFYVKIMRNMYLRINAFRQCLYIPKC